MSTVAEPITAAELLQMPRGQARYELIKGRLITMSPAGSEHGVVISRFSSLVEQFITAHNLGLVFGTETGFLLEKSLDTVRAPDIAFVRLERIPETGIPEGYWPGAPDLAVEVNSPSDTARAVAEKAESWIHMGTQSVWVVDPRSKTVTVYDATGAARTYFPGDSLDGGDVLPGFLCAVAEIFRFPSH
jgi:Uma2 family endonuclease